MSSAVPFDITVEEFKQKLDTGAAVVVLDVREPDEVAVSRLPGSVHIPMREIPARLAELDPDAEIICHCRMGGRSAKVVEFLRQQGFTNIRNLAGGLMEWAKKFEPTMPVA